VSRFRLPRRIRPTRDGVAYLFVTLAIGFAALNTQANLLYLVFGMLLALIMASGVLSEMSLRQLQVNREAPGRVFAGRPFLMGVGLKNTKRRFPSFSVEVEDLVEGRPLEKRCYFLKLPAGRRQQTSYRHRLPRRGAYRFTGFRISTRFPFSLFRKWRDVDLPGEVLVFPDLSPVAPWQRSAPANPGDTTFPRSGRTGDVHGVREFRAGDAARDIHWKKSAIDGRLMVREREDETRRRAQIILDNARPAGAPGDSRDDASFERAVGMAASLAAHYLALGFAVGLSVRGRSVPAAAGPAQLDRLLRLLALVDWAAPDEAIALPAGPHFGFHVGRDGVRPLAS
jgi:uncharacterized protein (DUF58 family)